MADCPSSTRILNFTTLLDTECLLAKIQFQYFDNDNKKPCQDLKLDL